jgi:ubiquinone biosynthesis protein UbiJ
MSEEWTELFAAFEQSLNQWLARAEELSSAPPPSTKPIVLHQFEERLKRLQAYLDKAEADAEEALAPLTTDIQALQQWLDALKTERAKLPELTVGSRSD